MDLIIDAGATNWQLAITVAMGNAADHPELLLQPWQMLELMPLLAELAVEGRERGLFLQPANNIGYFGPYESTIRNVLDDEIHFHGCNAGDTVMGIEADGTIKSCPGLRQRLCRRQHPRHAACARSGRRPSRSPSTAAARSTISGASAAPAIMPRPAWPAAPGPRTP